MSSLFEENYDTGYDEEEEFDDEEQSRDSRARRRRAQALASARRRAAARRDRRLPATPASPPATPPQRAVVNAVKELDLQTQVQQDTLQSAIAAQNRKFDRAALSTVATLLVSEGFRTFGTPDNNLVRAGIQILPLVAFPTGEKRKGIGGVIRHPAFYGGLGVLALAFIDDQRKRNSAVQNVDVLGPSRLTVGAVDLFVADVRDASGKVPANVTPAWESSNVAVAEINATTGQVTARSAGVTIISAKAGDIVRRVRLEVVAAGGK
ncbi:hypothetical protein GCM10009850_121160 [Nonomuraea monospora]|uniref:BIG2 domain-containing protein n=1 Tax=Nonomuraea monospora TaxID=568818 RepID=A0ABN3D5B9_9ACTN